MLDNRISGVGGKIILSYLFLICFVKRWVGRGLSTLVMLLFWKEW